MKGTLADGRDGVAQSTAKNVLGSSAFGGPGATSSAWFGVLTGPFAAWRLTNNSSGGTVTATVLQGGPR